MEALPLAIFRLDQLDIPTPPAHLFEDLLGYQGEKRFVAFWYECGHLYFSDEGGHGGTGNWHPWSVWQSFLSVEIRKHYCFGYDDLAKQHLLVLDRQTRKLFAGPVEVVREALRQQYPGYGKPVEPFVVENMEELENMADALFASIAHPIGEELLAEQKRLKDGTEKLKVWMRYKCRE